LGSNQKRLRHAMGITLGILPSSLRGPARRKVPGVAGPIPCSRIARSQTLMPVTQKF
jgi:hypothetical protein